MKALVTGAAGFIGSTLSTALVDRGLDVVGVDCFTDYYGRDIKEDNLARLRQQPKFAFVEAALQTADLDRLLDGVTVVYHLAAQAGVRKSWGDDFRIYTTNNVDATQRLLEAVKDRPLSRFVYASSSSVYGDIAAIPMREDVRLQPVSPYGVTKLAAEHLCHLYHVNFGVPAVSLRYFTVYGPRQRPDMGFHRFIRAALTGSAITLFGDGQQTRDFTYVGDAVAATMAAGDRGTPGAVYNIGGGNRVSIAEVLDLIGQLTGRPLDIRRQSSEKGDMRDTFADTTRARTDLGFSPAHTLQSGLAAEVEWLSRLLAVPRR
ncbi:MAG TPA: NAD-dependent epimerase/dehydratase family protein [Vicinamibacterales bacterium]|nr:NAD-dependent epimerase/dehydratase family protein [Vicinamibacterales bacterium]